MEEECIPEKVRHVHIPTFDEAREHILRACSLSVGIPKGVRKRHSYIYTVKIDRVYGYLRRAFLTNFENLSKYRIDGFYLEAIKIAGIENYVELVNGLRKKLRTIDRLTSIYRTKVRSSLDVREAKKFFREYVGRVLSIIRRSDDELGKVRDAVTLLSKMPCFEDLPTVVVAGMPQTGKSTFVGKVSTAKPKVSQFPFTTKEVVLGHATVEGVKLQIVDTPGILDRPLHELNAIERKAYVAIKYLADLVFFLIDPLETYYTLRSQLKLLSNIVEEFGSDKIVVLINKVDSAAPHKIEAVKELVHKNFSEIPVYCISALHGVGLQEVVEEALKRIRKVLKSGNP